MKCVQESCQYTTPLLVNAVCSWSIPLTQLIWCKPDAIHYVGRTTQRVRVLVCNNVVCEVREWTIHLASDEQVKVD